jgi:hypothetical protein
VTIKLTKKEKRVAAIAAWETRVAAHSDDLRAVASRTRDAGDLAVVRRAVDRLDLLMNLLKDSWEHHDYCGWGRDAWERERAGDLEKRIFKALGDLP